MIKIPSIEECMKIMEEHKMPSNIKAHSIKVRDVSVFLTKELNKKGKKLNERLVEASALLHDIAKIYCLNSREKHNEVGADLLRTMGYEKVADVVEQHINLWKKYKRLVEEEIVNYSDKRVMHDKLVSLQERFEDVKYRYACNEPETRERIKLTEKDSYRVEKRVFKNLDFSPDDLTKLLEK
jgi:putative nucleotidyltransferase with HDIG domain